MHGAQLDQRLRQLLEAMLGDTDPGGAGGAEGFLESCSPSVGKHHLSHPHGQPSQQQSQQQHLSTDDFRMYMYKVGASAALGAGTRDAMDRLARGPCGRSGLGGGGISAAVCVSTRPVSALAENACDTSICRRGPTSSAAAARLYLLRAAHVHKCGRHGEPPVPLRAGLRSPLRLGLGSAPSNPSLAAARPALPTPCCPSAMHHVGTPGEGPGAGPAYSHRESPLQCAWGRGITCTRHRGSASIARAPPRAASALCTNTSPPVRPGIQLCCSCPRWAHAFASLRAVRCFTSPAVAGAAYAARVYIGAKSTAVWQMGFGRAGRPAAPASAAVRRPAGLWASTVNSGVRRFAGSSCHSFPSPARAAATLAKAHIDARSRLPQRSLSFRHPGPTARHSVSAATPKQSQSVFRRGCLRSGVARGAGGPPPPKLGCPEREGFRMAAAGGRIRLNPGSRISATWLHPFETA
eukprot:359362-Chlamydomonas_euryale.AAC.7